MSDHVKEAFEDVKSKIEFQHMGKRAICAMLKESVARHHNNRKEKLDAFFHK